MNRFMKIVLDYSESLLVCVGHMALDLILLPVSGKDIGTDLDFRALIHETKRQWRIIAILNFQFTEIDRVFGKTGRGSRL
jgi:hypothetical protein